MSVIIQTENLTRKIKDKTIIDNFTFAFEDHHIYNILGPSGAGKSSLLRLLNRLDEPSGGSILIRGKNQCEFKPSEIRRRVGYLFQTPYLFSETVRDNLLYADDRLSESQMKEHIEAVHLTGDFLDTPIDNLSIGEQQRVALARLLALNPDILLLDEPTSALDPTATEAIEKLVREIVDQSKFTVIFITHNPQQAIRMGGRSLLMVKGKLIESGDSEQVVNSPRTEMGKLYKERKLQ